ncbi:MAG TPA: polysaccharide deacetylase family protein [Candidatus Choladocola avistercoris]|nr:polysaccharide deacetylase family protein [Candidatus Choladocola avistercoris]
MGWSRRYGNWIGAACLVLLAAGTLSGTEEEPEPVLPAGTSSAEMTEVWESEKKKIALTFDDGPHPVYTEQVLQVLDQGNIPATFFLLGQNIEEHQDLVKEIDAKGHLIGNHTYHHVQVTSLPLDQACEEIQKTSDLIESLTGKGTEYVRPPFGTWSEGLEDRLNLIPVMWTIDTLDWTTENVDEIVCRVTEQAEENGIILMHDGYESTVQALERFIPLLEAEGYEFVTVDQVIMD